MTNYLVLIRGSGPAYEKLNEDEQKDLFQKWGAYIGKLSESGNWVKGNPLADSGRLMCSEGVHEGVAGEADISVGGFMILQAENYDAAVELCKECPTFLIGGKMEIREAMEM